MEVFVIEKANEKRTMASILFFIYLIVLAWIVLLKMQFSFNNLPNIRGINLIPFAGSSIANNRVNLNEIILNTLAFVPFGLYISMLKPSWPLWKKVLPAACTSMAFEVLQYIFGIGASDITDLIDNTLGGFLGCVVYIALSRVLKERTHKVLCVVAMVGTVGLVALLGSLGVFAGHIRFAGPPGN